MNENIKPTLTLAQLYESQNQLVEALVIYQKLRTTNSSLEIEKKIDELTENIFSNLKGNYTQLINSIFTTAEKKYFKILPHEDYINLTRSSDDIDEVSSLRDILTEDESMEESIKKPGFDIEEEDEAIQASEMNPAVDTGEPEAAEEEAEVSASDVEPPDTEKDIAEEQVEEEDQGSVPEAASAQEKAASGEKREKKDELHHDDLDNNSIMAILENIKDLDVKGFETFLKSTFGPDRDLKEFKLSQIQKAIMLYKKEI
ncbi:MAG: hypothetical protein JXB60_09990 [Candidatus Cloacimonetes bacterium]|nr:hypothetical protein [Candidatus Cloacimonadota bacterium]